MQEAPTRGIAAEYVVKWFRHLSLANVPETILVSSFHLQVCCRLVTEVNLFASCSCAISWTSLGQDAHRETPPGVIVTRCVGRVL